MWASMRPLGKASSGPGGYAGYDDNRNRRSQATQPLLLPPLGTTHNRYSVKVFSAGLYRLDVATLLPGTLVYVLY